MKRTSITILIALMMSVTAFAKHVPVKTAKKVAQNYFLEKCGSEKSRFAFKHHITIKYKGDVVYYVFNKQKDQGFIIISADDAYTPVIGYSDKRNFIVKNRPASIDFWMDTYKKGISHLIRTKAKSTPKYKALWDRYSVEPETFQPKPVDRDAVVGPLTGDITWNQEKGSSPGFKDGWNAFCPPNTPTGCVATALGIIMYYWQYPIHGTGEYAYIDDPNSEYGKTIHNVNFGEATYLYANMLDDKPTYSSALLSYHIGVAMHMNYYTEGSGAYSQNVPTCIPEYFQYSDEMEYLYRTTVNDDAKWFKTLKEDLDAKRPVYYSGTSTENYGHAFICDGYNDEGLYSFNMGWGGWENGFYSIDLIQNSYDHNFAMVHNIKPLEEKYPYNPTVDTMYVEENTKNKDKYELKITWEAPKAKAEVMAYEIYEGVKSIAVVNDPSATSYIHKRDSGIVDYYAVRPIYKENEKEALTSSQFVDGRKRINFSIKNEKGQPAIGTYVTLNGVKRQMGYTPVDFKILWGKDYEYTIEHKSYEEVLTGKINVTSDTTVNFVLHKTMSGIDEAQEANIKVYPTPASKHLFIEGKINQNTNYTIVDITGKQVATGILTNGKNTINTEKLNAGIYFLNIPKLNLTKKFIVK